MPYCCKFIHQAVNCLPAGNSFTTTFMSKFSPTLSSRSVYHTGVIQKYTLLWSIVHHNIPYCTLTVTENKWSWLTAAYSWYIINKLWRMKCTARRETWWCQAVHYLIMSLHSRCYWPSGMLIHQQNLYVPRNKQCTDRHEAQSCELVNKVKKLTVYILSRAVGYAGRK
jgi:hypothetical protein